MKHWWKALAMVLLLAASIAALRVPLAPGIVYVSEARMNAGHGGTTVMGYATHFTKGAPKAFIENGGQFVQAAHVNVIDDLHLTVEFDMPTGLREDMSDLLVISEASGTMRLSDAFFYAEKGSGAEAGVVDAPQIDPVQKAYAFPNRALLNESIRNLNFHVPMWFTMMLLQTISLVYSIRVLRRGDPLHDRAAVEAVNVSLLFAFMGLITGSLWARATWDGWWTGDAKLNGAAITVLIYLAYLVLRGSITDGAKRARLAAIYNIFAYVLMLLFIMALPRLTASLHPGSGGNPAFSQYDLDDRLRPVFYTAVVGWMLLGTWIFTLNYRLRRIALAHDHH